VDALDGSLDSSDLLIHELSPSIEDAELEEDREGLDVCRGGAFVEDVLDRLPL
jgi:hypothetical protein